MGGKAPFNIDMKLYLLWILVASMATSALAQRKVDAPEDVPTIIKKAEMGDAKAQVQLAKLYFSGWKNESGLHLLNDRLGIVYFKGLTNDSSINLPRDHTLALKWYRLAAEQGNAEAQSAVGFYYYYGHPWQTNLVEAAKWFHKAAKGGEPAAQRELGVMYSNGIVVQKDEAEAAKWYRKAAEQGERRAQYNLGVLYSNGRGVPKDDVSAYKWCLLARDQGLQKPNEDIRVLEHRMTPDQRAEGQKLAREFKQKTE